MEILAGFLIALAIGVTGVGAGSITAPILILFFHQSASDAVTTALVFGTVVKLIATPIYLSRGHVNFGILKYIALGGLPAVLLGSLIMRARSESHDQPRAVDRGINRARHGRGHPLAQSREDHRR